MDVEPGPVRAEAEPEDESDQAKNEKKRQENGPYELGDAGGEGFMDPVGVVPDLAVVALDGSGFRRVAVRISSRVGHG